MKSQVRGCYNITFICTPTRPGKQLHLTRYPLSFLHKPFSRSFICVSKSQLQQLTAVRHVSTLDACRGPVSGAEKCLVLTDVWCWPVPVVDRYLVLTDVVDRYLVLTDVVDRYLVLTDVCYWPMWFRVGLWNCSLKTVHYHCWPATVTSPLHKQKRSSVHFLFALFL